MEMPTFDGGQPEVWLYQAEQYFALHEMEEASKLRAARICAIGLAQVWLQMEEKKRPFVTWQELRNQLSVRFEGADAITLRQRFLTVRQETTVAVYRERFELLLVSDEPEVEDPGPDLEPENEETLDGVELSINAVEGLAEPKTLKLIGQIREHSAIVMIDCGATHNFISPNLIALLELPVTETRPYGVLIGNGEKHQASGICRNLQIQIGTFTIVEDFLPMPMGSSDVILGMKWLASIGEMKAD